MEGAGMTNTQLFALFAVALVAFWYPWLVGIAEMLGLGTCWTELQCFNCEGWL